MDSGSILIYQRVSYIIPYWKLGLSQYQWEFGDAKMELLYHIRTYFLGVFPYIALTYPLYMIVASHLGSFTP